MSASKDNYVVHTAVEIEGIRGAAKTVAGVREALCGSIRPGMSTGELDRLARDLFAEQGVASAFLNYRGFPGQICISINDEVVHGIGDDTRIIRMGDLVKVDVGVKKNNFIGDTAKTVCVGPPTGRVAELMKATEESLMAGIAAAVYGNTVYDIGRAIEGHIKPTGFSVVRDFVGHGCGVTLHEPPEVPNYPSPKAKEKLRPGMVLALEPMVNLGTPKVKIDAEDGWTVRTTDGSLSAHYEHMILITDGKPEILTWPKSA